MALKLLSTGIFVLFMAGIATFQDDGFRSYRGVYLFSPSEGHPLLVEGLSLLQENMDKVKERDIKVFALFPDYGRVAGEASMRAGEVESLRKRYKIAVDQFALVLVGKDGYEKLRWDNKLKPLSELFSLIDSMPMRQREMREQTADGSN